ncbi:unnamed protein product [Ixodes persulcatus]
MPEKQNKNNKIIKQEHERCVWVSYKGNTERKLGTETRNQQREESCGRAPRVGRRRGHPEQGKRATQTTAVRKETTIFI